MFGSRAFSRCFHQYLKRERSNSSSGCHALGGGKGVSEVCVSLNLVCAALQR